MAEALGTPPDDLIALIKKNLPEMEIKLNEEKIAELAPRFENNKSLRKCFGAADRVFAEALLRRLFKEKKQ